MTKVTDNIKDELAWPNFIIERPSQDPAIHDSTDQSSLR